MLKSFHDTPVLDFSLRKFEKPSGSFKDLLKKFCISVGLLQPGDSRDVIVELLSLFIKAGKVKRFLSIDEVYKYVINIDKRGVSQSNTRRHLLRLKEFEFIEKTDNGYRLREWLPITDLFKEFIKIKAEPTINRIVEYTELIDKEE